MGNFTSARRTWVIRGMLLSSAWLAVACGGRSLTTDGAGGTSDSNGGAIAQAGNSAQGGATAQGGASGCGPVACPNLSCADGMLVSVAGSCCPVCQPTCQQACPAVNCASGSHLGTAPGACCPSCISDPAGQACEDGQKAYASYRDSVIAKFQALGCQSNTDCIGAQIMNLCESDCRGIAVLRSEAMQLPAVLNAEAAADCATCGGVVSACILVPWGAYCASGVCTNGL